jgi:exonuclease III
VSKITSLHHKLKVYSIAKLKSDFILLSDTRLPSDNISNDLITNKIKQSFLINPYCAYKCFFNSIGSSRGVGILIRDSLNITVCSEDRDESGNILALVISAGGKQMLLISVYGPNKHDETFFSNLDHILAKHKGLQVVVGGDWNLTPSPLQAGINPDVLNMAKIPNEKHTRLLQKIQLKHFLVDAFRILHPNRTEFSYAPWGNRAENRSRIDFVLISRELTSSLSECNISPTVQSSLFDHKATFLSFVPIKRFSKIDSILNKTVLDPLTEFVVSLANFEHSLLSLDPDDATSVGIHIRHLLEDIGVGVTLVRSCAAILHSEEGITDASRVIFDQYQARIRLILLNLSEINLEGITRNIDHDIFLESLVMHVRNAVLGYQRFITKSEKEIKLKLTTDLERLKLNYPGNLDNISMIENRLNSILDSEIKAEVAKFRHYEIIHNEKITPTFLKLAKSLNKDYSLNDICDDGGNTFLTDTARHKYITDYFANIYVKPKCDFNRGKNLIEKFLGPDVLNNPVCLASKLSEVESRDLDQPLSIAELDSALRQANSKSAPGLDGLNMGFITKFWDIFRIPLLNYSNTCFEKGSLTPTFRSAGVRLIPKKGCKKSIKNWRPISLLSNLYKILSRALNNRLKKIVDRVTTRAQKGFTDSRYIQEVLINVIDCIGYAKKNNLNGAVVSIDMSKAFDTISHEFLSECYRFFNFGPVFTNMLETVGKNRSACILLDNGGISNSFPLNSGRPQGENLSPIQYNICNQIFLMKIELDPNIKSIVNAVFGPACPFPIPCNDFGYNKLFSEESCRETDKAEGFADDSTALILADQRSISFLEKSLVDFSEISGLSCNFEKSSITFIGDAPANLATKFTVSDNFTLLGMTIDRNLECLQDNFLKTLKKIVSTINFWQRFDL